MPVIAWHILAGNHLIVDYLIRKGAEINTPFEGIDREGEPVGTFLVRYFFIVDSLNPNSVSIYIILIQTLTYLFFQYFFHQS